MKFSEIDEGRWPELKPYLDTCLLPVTGLDGTEAPWQATKALEELRDLLDAVEIPFHGRVVTYPAFHYGGKEGGEELKRICANLRESGFAYVMAAFRGMPPPELAADPDSGIDLMLSAAEYGTVDAAAKAAIHRRVVAMWQRDRDKSERL